MASKFLYFGEMLPPPLSPTLERVRGEENAPLVLLSVKYVRVRSEAHVEKHMSHMSHTWSSILWDGHV